MIELNFYLVMTSPRKSNELLEIFNKIRQTEDQNDTVDYKEVLETVKTTKKTTENESYRAYLKETLFLPEKFM